MSKRDLIIKETLTFLFEKGMEHVLSSKNNAELWTIEEVSQFIKTIPGCNKLNELFEKEVDIFY